MVNLVRGDIGVPSVWVGDWKTLRTQLSHLGFVSRGKWSINKVLNKDTRSVTYVCLRYIPHISLTWNNGEFRAIIALPLFVLIRAQSFPKRAHRLTCPDWWRAGRGWWTILTSEKRSSSGSYCNKLRRSR